MKTKGSTVMETYFGDGEFHKRLSTICDGMVSSCIFV